MKTIMKFMLLVCLTLSPILFIQAQQLEVEEEFGIFKTNLFGHTIYDRLETTDPADKLFQMGQRVNGTFDLSYGDLVSGYIFETDENVLMKFMKDGKVGIGTLEPEELLDVEGNIALTESNNADKTTFKLSAGNFELFNQSDDGNMNFRSKGTFKFQGNTGSTTYFAIEDDGDAVIGNSNTNNDAQLTIWDNSTTTHPHLRIRETLNNDRVRIFLESGPDFADSRFSINANPGAGEPVMNFYYTNGTNSGNVLTLDGDDRRVGIRKSSPEGDLHINQSDDIVGTGAGGIFLEESDSDDLWRIYHASTASLSFDYNGTRVGYLNTSGSFIDNVPFTSNGSTNKSYSKALSTIQNMKIQNNGTELGIDRKILESTFPEAIYTSEDGQVGERPEQISYLALASVQEQQELITQQQSEITKLRTLIDALNARLEAVEQK